MFQQQMMAILATVWLVSMATAAVPAGEDKIKPLLSNESLSAYKLVWHDEFDGKALDMNRWHYRTDSRWSSTQLPENVSVQDGKLRLTLKKEQAQNKEYTGGGVISKRHFGFGYYEARFKVPATPGWHTSFWLAGFDDMRPNQGASGGRHEMDVCEQDSYKPCMYTLNLHMRKPKGKSMGFKRIPTPDLTKEFHVWGCEFTRNRVRYFFDGKEVQSLDISQFETGDQQIWLTSIAANIGKKTGNPVYKDLPACAEYDYVRFFEKEPVQ